MTGSSGGRKMIKRISLILWLFVGLAILATVAITAPQNLPILIKACLVGGPFVP